MVLEFAFGAREVVEMNFGESRGMVDDSTEVITDAAALRLGEVEARSSGYRSHPPLEVFRDGAWCVEEVRVMSWQETVAASVGEFVRPLAAGEPSPATGEEGREIVRWIEEAYRRPILVSRFTAAGRPTSYAGWSAGREVPGRPSE